MSYIHENITFEKVVGSNDNINTLYKLLSLRDHFISHSKMPSYDEHKKFVLNNPYNNWYLINNKDKRLGTFYTKADNSIGINLIENNKEIVIKILDFIKLNLKPKPNQPSVVTPYFYINIPISNIKLRNIFEELDTKSIQISYKLNDNN